MHPKTTIHPAAHPSAEHTASNRTSAPSTPPTYTGSSQTPAAPTTPGRTSPPSPTQSPHTHSDRAHPANTYRSDERPLHRGRRIRSPLQNLLRPVHPHIVVHPPKLDHLYLRRIPKLVVRLRAFKLLQANTAAPAHPAHAPQSSSSPSSPRTRSVVVRVCTSQNSPPAPATQSAR